MALPEGPLRSLLIDGILGGIGAVVIFLPQIFILFLILTSLEECGYLARAAYLMDRLMVRVGLSGQVVHTPAIVICLCDPGGDGHAGHREPARPLDDDPDRPAHELSAPACRFTP